jgi:hypothetical protein
MLAKNAEAYEFTGDVWTNAKVATLITQQFALTLCARQIRRLLHQCTWNRQVLLLRAEWRDHAAWTAGLC